jgi:hypothetical protein
MQVANLNLRDVALFAPVQLNLAEPGSLLAIIALSAEQCRAGARGMIKDLINAAASAAERRASRTLDSSAEDSRGIQ